MRLQVQFSPGLLSFIIIPPYVASLPVPLLLSANRETGFLIAILVAYKKE
jgi:hypothetical protein